MNYPGLSDNLSNGLSHMPAPWENWENRKSGQSCIATTIHALLASIPVSPPAWITQFKHLSYVYLAAPSESLMTPWVSHISFLVSPDNAISVLHIRPLYSSNLSRKTGALCSQGQSTLLPPYDTVPAEVSG